MKERLNNYISISIFMAMNYGMEEEALKLLYYNQQLANDLSPRHRSQLMDSEMFVSDLIEQVIKYDERKIFDLLFTRISNWDILFKEDVLKVYMQMNNTDYLVRFLHSYNEHLKLDTDQPARRRKVDSK